MSRAPHLREQAKTFRDYARTDSTGLLRDRLLALAEQCDDLAASLETAEKKSRKD
jgi:hypothetical protein